ncbi:uncharacterized protein LAJ45_04714 [Morchella importuna]|uniref:PQ-loop-domain-containing protein n=1 Tax=Morchella conica CCBAS932 TaxID=1392247 RepID=A0A3N4KG29_9PEZI|nr:uncharacterized protein LAJ45_04714 [Morchella importuna]KAH8151013.1 hypothetical protein LAJ45_04714 [Morchella importuna]RPB08428.1 PQ-loop-domain-containing protein [Morchella conica CCBAS932]
MMMFPPSHHLNVDARAISGIVGSISIACWIVVFSPQIITNFRRGSAEGLSLAFLIVWLAGDVFNVLGAVLQGVLPTMVILAVYYTIADVVLLFQCLYYKRLNSTPTLLEHDVPAITLSVDGSHLSPATPLLDPLSKDLIPERPQRLAQTILFNLTAILSVCIAGVFGWWISEAEYPHHDDPTSPPADIQFSQLGQIFGYLCAVLYLASRLPQILLNYRRKSCDGISLLFFLFACLGNLTYVVSILAYVPRAGNADEARDEYRKYVAVNASWLLGSFGTLGLDLVIFAQFFWYRDLVAECDREEEEESSVLSSDDEADLDVRVCVG